MKILVLFLVTVAVAGCGNSSPRPMDGFMDPPSVEFRNAEGTGRWCISPDTPGLLAGSVYRACRDNLLAEGYREIGPWCGGAAPTGGDSLGAFFFGGFVGVATVNARAAQYEACRQRQVAQSEGAAPQGGPSAAPPPPGPPVPASNP